MGADVYLSYADNTGNYQFTSKKKYSPNDFSSTGTRTILYTKDELSALGITDSKIFKIRVNLFDDISNETIAYSSEITYKYSDDYYDPTIEVTGLPDCVSEKYIGKKCIKTGEDIFLKFDINDIDGDLKEFKLYLNNKINTIFTESLSGSNGVISKTINYSVDDLSPCEEWEKYNGVCHKNKITITATAIDERQIQYDVGQFTEELIVYDSENSYKAQKELDEIAYNESISIKIEERADKEEEKNENKTIYDDNCKQVYESKSFTKLDTPRYRHIIDGVEVYGDMSSEYRIEGSGKINDIHPYRILVSYAKDINYPAQVDIWYTIIGYPLKNGAERYNHFTVLNYDDKELAKTMLVHQIIIDNFNDEICSDKLNNSNTPSMFSYVSTVEELANELTSKNENDKKSLYPPVKHWKNWTLFTTQKISYC